MADLILYTGPMFSSKTTRLLMEADKRHYQKQKSVAFKSSMDDRYSAVGEIVTHNFNKLPALLVDDGSEIIAEITNVDNVDCIVVDELFLIKGSAAACLALYKKGYDVIMASIDLSFKGEPFDEVKEIMPYCTKIVKCKAVCTECGDDARYTYRKVDSEDEILVGADEFYEPRCQLHYNYMKA